MALTPEERRERARQWQHEHRRKLGIPERIKRTPEEQRVRLREQKRLAGIRWRRAHGAKPAVRLPAMSPEDRKAYDYARRVAWRQQHPEKVLRSSRASYARHQKKNQQRSLAYYYEHLDESRAKSAARNAANRPQEQARTRKRRQENPAPFRAKELRRRALKRGAPVSDYTAAQWREQQEVQDHRCSYCGKRRKGKLTQDHIIPLSKGGSHTASNIIAVCQSCNSKKSDKAPPIPVQMNLLMVAPPFKKKKGA